MNIKSRNHLIIQSIAGFFLFLFVIQGVIQVNPNNKTDETVPTEKLVNSGPLAQDDYELLNLPFYFNTTGLSNWLINEVMDPSTSLSTTPLFYDATNRAGSVVVDKDHNFEAIAVYMDGLAELLNLNKNDLANYYSQLLNSEFYDTTSGKTGFFTSIYENRTSATTVKELESNIQVILSFSDWGISSLYTGPMYSMDQRVISQWENLERNFKDNPSVAADGFNHSTSDHDKFIRDQLLVAIAGFQIYRANRFSNPTVALRANQTATAIMAQLLKTSEYIYEQNSFQFKRDSEFGYVSEGDRKELRTNAYGIWALADWYAQSTKIVTSALQKAVSTYNFMEHLWNSTFNLYYTNASPSGVDIYDRTMYLQDNAIMMSALVRLLEITGDFTYFKRIMQIYQGIQANLYDSVYGTYYTSFDPVSEIADTTKKFIDHAYLYRAYSAIKDLSRYLSTSVYKNTTNCIKDTISALNFTLRLNMKSVVNYTLGDGKKVLIQNNINVSNPSFFAVVQYPNNTELTTYSGQGNNKGNKSFILQFLESYPLGSYKIAYYANYTGLTTQVNSFTFDLVSGFNLKSAKWNSTSLYSGAKYLLNLTINNTRNDNITTTFKLNSSILDSIIEVPGKELLNDTIKSYLFNVSISKIAPLGLSNLAIGIYRNNFLYGNFTLAMNISSSVKIQDIQSSSNGFSNYAYTATVTLKNLIDSPQNVSLYFYGEYFTSVTKTFEEVNANSMKVIALNSQISATAPMNAISYTINITRSSDGELIYSHEYTINVVPKIEIISIDFPAESYQWGQTYAVLVIRNNLPIPQQITIELEGKEVQDVPILLPGENIIDLPVDNGYPSPYAFGTRMYTLDIFYGGSEPIFSQILITNVNLSAGSFIVGYLLPILIPIIGVVVFRHLDLENKKRLIE